MPGWTLPGVMTCRRCASPAEGVGARAGRPHGARGIGAAHLPARFAVSRRRRDDRGAPRYDTARTPCRALPSRIAASSRSRVLRERPGAASGEVRATVPVRATCVCAGRGRTDRVQRVRYRRPTAGAARSTAISCCCTRASSRTSTSRGDRLRARMGRRQRCLRPRVDAFGASSVAGIWIAGDGGGIQARGPRSTAGRSRRSTRAPPLRIDEGRRDSLAMRPSPRMLARANARAPVLRRAVCARACVSRVPAGRDDRLPLRGSDGPAGSRRDRARLHRSEPAQGVRALRHGPAARAGCAASRSWNSSPTRAGVPAARCRLLPPARSRSSR